MVLTCAAVFQPIRSIRFVSKTAIFVLQAIGGNIFVDRGSSMDVMSKIYFTGNTLRYLSDQAMVRSTKQTEQGFPCGPKISTEGIWTK